MRSLGPEQSIDLFPAATWAGYDASQAPTADYPGLRPTGSWMLEPDGWLHGLDPFEGSWFERDTAESVDLSGRRLVLAYGSNPDPVKLLDNRRFFGGEPVVGLRAAIFGWAAVWCDSRRSSDDSVVATLGELPGRLEVHPVLALTPHQRDAMDKWEGHPKWYRRSSFVGALLLESGQWRDDVEAYLGTDLRRARLDGGRPLLCADVPQADVDGLVARSFL